MLKNIEVILKSGVGTTFMGKTVTYILGSQPRELVTLPTIVVEDIESGVRETAEIGGRSRLSIPYNIWVYAGGTGNDKTDEQMKQRLRGILYSTFSKKYSLPFFDYISNINDGYFSCDISVRVTPVSIYSKIDSHKLIGSLSTSIIY
jgi:hypothetical protein